MFNKLARAVCLAAALAAGAVGLSAAPAAATSLSFGITISKTYADKGDYRHGRHVRPARDFCAPRRALREARRQFGVRNAHVVRENRRAIVVAGRSRGDQAVVRFAQRRDCPVISYRRR